jgi:hypothetical protein
MAVASSSSNSRLKQTGHLACDETTGSLEGDMNEQIDQDVFFHITLTCPECGREDDYAVLPQHNDLPRIGLCACDAVFVFQAHFAVTAEVYALQPHPQAGQRSSDME